MSRKRYTPEQISACCAKPRWPWRRASPLVKLVPATTSDVRVTISMLREAEVALAQGQSVGQACRTLGVSEQRWRKV